MSDRNDEAWPTPPGEAEVRRLLERARGGDATEMAALRAALDDHPETWQAYGDLAGHAQGAWIDLIAGVDLALKEALGRRVEALKAELAGPDPSPLETLLIERVAACWLQVGHADAAAVPTGPVSIPQGDHARKRQDSAHQRYLAAVGALAMTRRLLGSTGAATPGSAKLPAEAVEARSEDPGPEERVSVEPEGEPGEGGGVLEFAPIRGRAGTGKPGRRRPPGASSAP